MRCSNFDVVIFCKKFCNCLFSGMRIISSCSYPFLRRKVNLNRFFVKSSEELMFELNIDSTLPLNQILFICFCAFQRSKEPRSDNVIC